MFPRSLQRLLRTESSRLTKGLVLPESLPDTFPTGREVYLKVAHDVKAYLRLSVSESTGSLFRCLPSFVRWTAPMRHQLGCHRGSDLPRFRAESLAQHTTRAPACPTKPLAKSGGALRK